MISASVAFVLAVAVPTGNLCPLCHSDVRVEFESGVHLREGIGCTSCHGGDPAASTVAAAHRGGFRGVPRRRQIPALCASCHSDIARMRPWNLPTDQYALYQTSRHGIRLAQGDERVAVCTDCHGVHAIRARDDPQSSIFVNNIPRTCGRCHADAALMERYGVREDAYAEYRASVHGRALLDQGNATAPECSRCHGAHGAAPPGLGDIEKACGQCHAAARAYFLQGPHKEGMDAAGFPECASCHGHHRVLRAERDLLDTVCLKCHATGSAPEEVARAMKALLVGASEAIDRARALVDRAAAIPLYVEDYEARLGEARAAVVEALPATHALALGRIEEMTRRARSIANEVESEVNGKFEQRKWRPIGLLVFWFYLLLALGVLLRFRQRAGRVSP